MEVFVQSQAMIPRPYFDDPPRYTSSDPPRYTSNDPPRYTSNDPPRYTSKDSGVDTDDSPKKLFPAEPNLESVRHELGKEGHLINKAVWENTGLIPKYYKPYSLIETQDKSNAVPLYKCHFCKLVYKGHNSIVYHCRRHIGDYPYKCQECGFVEVCKSGLSSHMRRTGHQNCLKVEGPDRVSVKTFTPTVKVSKLPEREEFASEIIRDRSILSKKRPSSFSVRQSSCSVKAVAIFPKADADLSSSFEVNSADSTESDSDEKSSSSNYSSPPGSLQKPVPDFCRNRVVPRSTGLIPKFLKPFQQVTGDNGTAIYSCDFCDNTFRGHNSIVYHTRRHIGDFPYRCVTCGYAEVSKCALNQHISSFNHAGAILLKHAHKFEDDLDLRAEPIVEPPTKRTKLVIVPHSPNYDSEGKSSSIHSPPIELTIPKGTDDGPDLNFLIWFAEQKPTIKPTINSWKFCADCNSAFFNDELFNSHLASCT